jgi:hypothetical protein
MSSTVKQEQSSLDQPTQQRESETQQPKPSTTDRVIDSEYLWNAIRPNPALFVAFINGHKSTQIWLLFSFRILFFSRLSATFLRNVVMPSICSPYLHPARASLDLPSLIHLCSLSSLCFLGVKFPPKHKLTVAEVFVGRNGQPNLELLKKYFIAEGRVDETTALRIIQDGATLLKAENTMIDIEAPVTVRDCICSLEESLINAFVASLSFFYVWRLAAGQVCGDVHGNLI